VVEEAEVVVEVFLLRLLMTDSPLLMMKVLEVVVVEALMVILTLMVVEVELVVVQE
jgi:hypothetical protein